MEQKKIMIVEDERSINEMYTMKFKKEGFDVLQVFDGLEALTKISEYKPDIILLDLMMPNMDGFETLKVIKDQITTLKTKIIIFSNINNQKDIEKAYELGADDYLIKANTTPKEIFEKVSTMLGNNINHEICNCIGNCKEIIFECPCCKEKLVIKIEKV